MTTTPEPIEICRAGTFTSVQGTTVTFTEADLAGMASSYDRADEPAPLVTGHPGLDAPAYGWVAGLAIHDGKLVATPEDVEPSFAEAVAAKRYRRVSPEFYPPAHPSNPRPGNWYLKHVGFLGAAAPAIRGLRPVSFSEAQVDGAVTIDLDPKELTMSTEAETAAFAEREAAVTTAEAELATREAAVKAREDASEKAARDAVHNGNVSFAEGMVTGGKLAPAGKDQLVLVMDTLAASAVVSFGEAGATVAPLDAFKELLNAAQPIISFSEAAAATDKQVSVVSFAAPAGHTVDAASLELHGKALAYQADHSGVAYLDAVRAVS